MADAHLVSQHLPCLEVQASGDVLASPKCARVLSGRPILRPFWRLKVVYRYPGSACCGRRQRRTPVVLALAEVYSSRAIYPEPFKPRL